MTLKTTGGNVVTVPASSSVAVAVNWSSASDTNRIGYKRLAIGVTISGGTSSTNFTVTATDDYLKGSESLIATIAGVTDTNNLYEAVAPATGGGNVANSAITDEVTPGVTDTVYAVISGPAGVAEGDTATNYTVKLVDSNGNPVTVSSNTTVTVKFTNGTAEVSDYVDTDQTLTITAGSKQRDLYRRPLIKMLIFDNDTFIASIKERARYCPIWGNQY